MSFLCLNYYFSIIFQVLAINLDGSLTLAGSNQVMLVNGSSCCGPYPGQAILPGWLDLDLKVYEHTHRLYSIGERMVKNSNKNMKTSTKNLYKN